MASDPSSRSARGSLAVTGVSKSRGAVRVLEEVSLAVEPGEFVTLLGPSGCGKTTLLRLIAGLDAVDSGRIAVSGADVTAMPAHERPVHTVFQSYALFPHLTVFENVAFGLRLRGVSDADIRTRVAKVLGAVRLENLEDRMPAQISGGQGQRVALARALVLEPDILLLDEPLAALDAQLRSAMRSELVQLQRSLGTTFILVTHDLEEAIECSSRIAVMRAGRIEQMAEPRAIFERPASLYVARLVGMENIFEGRVLSGEAGRLSVDLGFARVEARMSAAPGGTGIRLAAHGEHVRVSRDGEGLAGTVTDVRYLGETLRCVVTVCEARLVANLPPRETFAVGEAVRVDIEPAAWAVLER